MLKESAQQLENQENSHLKQNTTKPRDHIAKISTPNTIPTAPTTLDGPLDDIAAGEIASPGPMRPNEEPKTVGDTVSGGPTEPLELENFHPSTEDPSLSTL